MDYDKIDVAARYVQGRAPLTEGLDAWLRAIQGHVRSSEVSRIVDVGCGAGRFTAALGERFGASVVGLDPSQQMIRRVPGLRALPSLLAVASAEHLPLATGCSDLAFMSMVYHHLERVERALGELHSTLREDGYLCIRNSLVENLDSFIHLRFFPSARQHLEQVLPTAIEVEDKASKAGFQLVGQEMVNTVFTRSFSALQEKVQLRTQSELLAISDDEFRQGCQAMAGSAPSDDSEAIGITGGLFLFRRRRAEPP